MKISVFGTGYVGLVTGVCFAEMGNDVICADIDSDKVAKLKEGVSPIYEPGLDELIKNNLKANRIQFTTDMKLAVENSELLFIAVGTPSDVDGSADLKYVLQVAETIANHMNGNKVVVTKSTVPVGTHQKVSSQLSTTLVNVNKSWEFDIVSNPEFLREGNAIEDCLKPNRVIVGCDSQRASKLMHKLYDPFIKNGSPLIIMDLPSAEMTKYAANAMLATKISLMNEFSRVCEKVNANIESVRLGIGSDKRIGPHFIYAGVGYGGSCFPKDVKALIKIGRENHEILEILESVEGVNAKQKQNFIAKMNKNLEGFRNKKIALWGAAFKPGTDDIREAPSLEIIEALLNEGAYVLAYDPVAAVHVKNHFKNHSNLIFKDNQYEVLENVDALCIVTEWTSFREPDLKRMKKQMKRALIFDGRNIYNPEDIREMGFEYYSVGRP